MTAVPDLNLNASLVFLGTLAKERSQPLLHLLALRVSTALLLILSFLSSRRSAAILQQYSPVLSWLASTPFLWLEIASNKKSTVAASHACHPYLLRHPSVTPS